VSYYLDYNIINPSKRGGKQLMEDLDYHNPQTKANIKYSRNLEMLIRMNFVKAYKKPQAKYACG
jgi:hypothetical protein